SKASWNPCVASRMTLRSTCRMECGIGVKSYNDVKVGDKIEVFEKVQVARSL
ncbi:hypothetical protein SAMN04490206_0001, partial [Pseudomonas umsongensis]